MFTRSFRFIIPTLLLATLPTVAKADIIYGSIASSLTNTQLFSINTATNAQVAIATTTLPYINGLAFDATNNYLYYRGGTGGVSPVNGNANFYRYNLTTNVQTQLALASAFGNLPATNAAFYNGNYWYIGQNSDTLVRFSLTTLTATTFDINLASTFGYAYNGDIAINSSGMLYSSSINAFFRVNVSSGTPTGFTPILTGTTSNTTNAVNRQLAFLANGTLLGYKSVTGTGATPWATINLANGATAAAPPLTNLQAYGDLASGIAVVPEASTLALALPAFGMIGAVVLRRRKK